jgi:hypothetical protein
MKASAIGSSDLHPLATPLKAGWRSGDPLVHQIGTDLGIFNPRPPTLYEAVCTNPGSFAKFTKAGVQFLDRPKAAGSGGQFASYRGSLLLGELVVIVGNSEHDRLVQGH